MSTKNPQPNAYRLVAGKYSAEHKRFTKTDFSRDLSLMFEEMFRKKLAENPLVDGFALESRLKRTIENGFVQELREWLGEWMKQYSSEQGPPSQMRVPRILQFNQLNGSTYKSAGLGKTKLGLSAVNQPGHVPWHALKLATIRKKSKASPLKGDRSYMQARRFFQDTGVLKQQLTGGVRDMVRRTGPAVVDYKPQNRKSGRFEQKGPTNRLIPLGEVSIRIMSNATRTALPGISAMDWTKDAGNERFEKLLGFDEDALRKLGNRPEPGKSGHNMQKRPLLQPMFTYLYLFLGPKLALEAMQKEVSKKRQRRS